MLSALHLKGWEGLDCSLCELVGGKIHYKKTRGCAALKGVSSPSLQVC